jgi:hypothetical protein
MLNYHVILFFVVTHQVLEWDEFWRFMHDLELGLDDQQIATLRQKVDCFFFVQPPLQFLFVLVLR